MVVARQHIVTLRYTMKDGHGVLLEDRMNGEPTEFLYGTGKILPELEAHLAGMTPGQATSFAFTTGIGSSEASFHFDVVVESVRPATTTELESGYPDKNESTACGPDCECW